MIWTSRKFKKYWVFLSLFLGISSGIMAQDIKVLTYNVRLDVESDMENSWENRKEFLIGQLNFYNPTVFGTQEGFKHQLEAIKNGMTNYTYIGKGRDDGKEEGEYSAIFYDTNSLDLLQNDTFWLSERPAIPSIGWDASYKRVCTYGLFEIKNSGKKFWVFNTHFDHQGKEAREKSAQLLLEKVKQINHEGLPVIVMGDFNLEPDHKTIAFITSEFNDAHTLAGKEAFGPEGTYNGFNLNKAVTRRIDYLFLSKEKIKLKKYAILSDSKDLRYPSDHLPVFAIISF